MSGKIREKTDSTDSKLISTSRFCEFLLMILDSQDFQATLRLVDKGIYFSVLTPLLPLPIPSMYGIYIYTYIYCKNQPNVGKYTIHGWYGVLLEPDHILSEASMNLLHELCKSQPEISLTVSKTCRGKKHISLVSS